MGREAGASAPRPAAPAARPAKPDLRPAGPIVRAVDAGTWTDAADAIAGANRYAERTRGWARAAYVRARERGFAEGRTEGVAEAGRLAADASAQTTRLLAAIEGQLPRLVLEVVEGILGSFDPGEILPFAVRQAVSRLGNGAEVRIRVAPALAEEMRRVVDELGDVGGARAIRVEADPGLEPGACVMWSEFGNVDLSVAAQLKAFRSGLEAASPAEPGP